MTFTVKILGIVMFLTGQIAYGQSNIEKAREKGRQAIKLEDEGKYSEALKLLNEAQKLDPDAYNYPYEIGYTYLLQKEDQKALDEFKKVVKYKNVTDQCFQMLGNIYDIMKDSINALKSYDEGLKMFPKSGRLYLEKGNVYWNREEYARALPFYEEGIIADPNFPSNYYRATRIYCASSEKVWGVLYGEIFMNLERNSERTSEISTLLYKAYKSSINVTSDTSGGVDFSKYASVDVNKKFTVPFQLTYGLTMTMSLALNIIAKEKELTLSSIDNIRSNFIKNWYDQKRNKDNPNILFDYNQILMKEGHFEAYNHWIFMKGNEDEFTNWQNLNAKKWDNFTTWFAANKINIDETHKFYSGQY